MLVQFGVRQHRFIPIACTNKPQHSPTCAVRCGKYYKQWCQFFFFLCNLIPFKKKKKKKIYQSHQALKWEDWDEANAVKETGVCSAHFISGKLSFISLVCKGMLKSLAFTENCVSVHICTCETFLFCRDGHSFPFILVEALLNMSIVIGIKRRMRIDFFVCMD